MRESGRMCISILSIIHEGMSFLWSEEVKEEERIYVLDSLVEGVETCSKSVSLSEEECQLMKEKLLALKIFFSIKNLEQVEEALAEWEDRVVKGLLPAEGSATVNATEPQKTSQECIDSDNQIITINTDLLDLPVEGESLYQSRANISKLIGGEVTPLVSIVVIAYNRLDKTKNCVESILKYTDPVDYELILVDNGSDPDVLEYFRTVSLKNKKIIRITKNLQMSFAVIKGFAVCSGQFLAMIANDLIVTDNWLKNLMACFQADSKVGMVCTMSSNVSNLQDAQLTFHSLEEMQKKAASYNVSDSRKWHERMRLITIGTVFRRECLDIFGGFDYGFYHDFIDDDISFKVRRAGYKTVLCKDVFIMHDHVHGTDKDPGELEKSLRKGREDFQSKYDGIDAWDDVNNFELSMISMVQKSKRKENIQVLGIDVRCGTPILEVKNKLREFNQFDTQLSAFSQDAKYQTDLRTICQGQVICDRVDYFHEHFRREFFDYVLLGEAVNLYPNMRKMLTRTYDLLLNGGQCFFKLKNTANLHKYLYLTTESHPAIIEQVVADIRVERLLEELKKIGFKKWEVQMEQYAVGKETMQSFRDHLGQTLKSSQLDGVLNKLLTNHYIISAIK